MGSSLLFCRALFWEKSVCWLWSGCENNNYLISSLVDSPFAFSTNVPMRFCVWCIHLALAAHNFFTVCTDHFICLKARNHLPTYFTVFLQSPHFLYSFLYFRFLFCNTSHNGIVIIMPIFLTGASAILRRINTLMKEL